MCSRDEALPQMDILEDIYRVYLWRRPNPKKRRPNPNSFEGLCAGRWLQPKAKI